MFVSGAFVSLGFPSYINTLRAVSHSVLFASKMPSASKTCHQIPVAKQLRNDRIFSIFLGRGQGGEMGRQEGKNVLSCITSNDKWTSHQIKNTWDFLVPPTSLMSIVLLAPTAPNKRILCISWLAHYDPAKIKTFTYYLFQWANPRPQKWISLRHVLHNILLLLIF